MKTEETHQRSTKLFEIGLGIIIVSGLLNLIHLLLIPSGGKNPIILNYSLSRLILFIFFFLGVFLSLVVLFQKETNKEKVIRFVQAWFAKTPTVTFFMILLVVTTFLVWLAYFSPPYFLGRYYAIFNRLQPVLMWCESVLFVFSFWMININDIERKQEKSTKKNKILLFFSILIGIFAIYSTIALLYPRLTEDLWFGRYSVPILATQIFVAWSVLIIIKQLIFNVNIQLSYRYERYFDLIVFMAIWIIASLIWFAQPIEFMHDMNFTAIGQHLKPYPPTFEIFPWLDSRTYYLITESVKMGNGIYRSIDKSLFLTIASVLNWLANGSYILMLNYQSVLLALFPAIMYLFGKELHGRFAGLFIATIAILQEFNAIHLMDEFPLVSTKVLLSEPYMQLWNGLIVLAVILALKKYSKGFSSGFLISGGVIGLSVLCRLNTFVVIPFILLVFFMRFINDKRIFLQASLLFVLGVFLALSPWMVHNAIVYDDPFAFINAKLKGVIINKRFERISPEAESSIDAEPVIIEENHTSQYLNDTSVQYTSYTEEIREVSSGSFQPNAATKENTDLELDLVDQHYLVDSFGQNVNKIWRISLSIFRHFLNNLITSFSILPVSLVPQDLFHGSRTQRFWGSYDASLYVGIDFLVILVNLIFIALGIYTMIRKNREIGLIPLAVYLGYHLSNGVAISSGNRYTQPASWMIFFYYAIGLITISDWFITRINKKEFPIFIKADQRLSGNTPLFKHFIGLLLILLIFLLGLSPVIANVLPEKRFQINNSDLRSLILANNAVCNDAINQEELDINCAFNEVHFLEDFNFELGRIFIPLLINSLDYQEIFTPPTNPKDIDRTFYTFMFFGQSSIKPRQLIFINDRVVDNVKNGSDVLILTPKDNRDSITYLCVIDSGDLKIITKEVLEDADLSCYLSKIEE